MSSCCTSVAAVHPPVVHRTGGFLKKRMPLFSSPVGTLIRVAACRGVSENTKSVLQWHACASLRRSAPKNGRKIGAATVERLPGLARNAPTRNHCADCGGASVCSHGRGVGRPEVHPSVGQSALPARGAQSSASSEKKEPDQLTVLDRWRLSSPSTPRQWARTHHMKQRWSLFQGFQMAFFLARVLGSASRLWAAGARACRPAAARARLANTLP